MNNPDLPSLWKSVLIELELSVTTTTYKGLLSQLRLLELNEGVAKISSNNSFNLQQVETKYYTLIKTILDKHTRTSTSLIFTVQPSSKAPLEELPLFSSPSSTLNPKSYPLTPSSHANLGPQFTFDTFAVGSTNQLAFAAAEAVARNLGQAYNPLFIYGGVGVGKSHLMQAIGHSALDAQPDLKIIFCPGEHFTNEIISAIRNKTTQRFKEKYRKIDMLLLDDIQFIAGKDTVQEEFFHTFNAIHSTGGQIIMTSDRPPTDIIKLEDRLRSRFQAGLIVDIGEPDFELRTAILLIKSKQRGFELPMDLAQQVAHHIKSARELEGFLMQLTVALQQSPRTLDNLLISQLLGLDTSQNQPIRKGLRPHDIIKATAEYFDIKPAVLKSKTRLARIVLPRQIAMYLMRVELNYQLEAIGELLDRDHTTIMHGVEKIQDMLGKTPELTEHILHIRESLR